MTDIAAIHQDIGSLQASVGHLAKEQDRAALRDEKIFTLLDEIKNNQGFATQQNVGFAEKLEDVRTRLKGVEDGVADYRSMKRAGMAIYVGSVAIAGGIGWFVQYLAGLWPSRT